MPRVELRFVEHRTFGPGVVFASRVGDAGDLLDVWFVADEKLHLILAEHIADMAKPELSTSQRKALRSARSAYRKSRPRRTRDAANRPRARRPEAKLEWRRTFEFAGREDELAPAEEIEEAAR